MEFQGYVITKIVCRDNHSQAPLCNCFILESFCYNFIFNSFHVWHGSDIFLILIVFHRKFDNEHTRSPCGCDRLGGDSWQFTHRVDSSELHRACSPWRHAVHSMEQHQHGDNIRVSAAPVCMILPYHCPLESNETEQGVVGWGEILSRPTIVITC